jgi:hypothetical protein
MSETTRIKKGKNFKDVMFEEKNKGRITKRIMQTLVRINSSVIYACTFLLLFALIDVVCYFLLSPDVYVWAGILLFSAVVCSILSSRLTSALSKQRMRYIT